MLQARPRRAEVRKHLDCIEGPSALCNNKISRVSSLPRESLGTSVDSATSPEIINILISASQRGGVHIFRRRIHDLLVLQAINLLDWAGRVIGGAVFIHS